MRHKSDKIPELDENGRFQVSNKMLYDEYLRSVACRERLHISAIEYNEMAHRRLNDHHENVSPAIEIKSRSKMAEITEDVARITKDLEGHKEYTGTLEEQFLLVKDELAMYKKVSEKVNGGK